MNTVNIVLMVILAAMIGFAIGNVWGQAKVKSLFSNLLDQLTKGLKAAASSNESKKDAE